MWADKNDSLSAADKKIYDVEALKEQLIALRLQRMDVRKQRALLQKDVDELEEAITPLKQQYNILTQLNELRFAVDEDQSDGGNDDGGGGKEDDAAAAPAAAAVSGPAKLADSRFKLLDRKLEVQILNQDIKSVLGTLEKTALELEALIYPLEKEAKGAQESLGNIPEILCSTAEEIDAKIGDCVEARLLAKSAAQQDAVEAERKKMSMASDILRARETLSMLMDERECMKQAGERVRRAFLSEQATIRKLTEQSIELRERVGQYHNGRGWETEAFVGVVGSVHGRLEKHLVGKALLPWTPLEKINMLSNIELSEEKEMDIGDDNKGGNGNTRLVNFTEFCRICDLIVNVNENDNQRTYHK